MSCKADTPDVIALETRIAIYGYVACSVLLGLLTWIGTRWRRQIENEEDAEKYAEKVVKHIHDVDQSVMTLTLTGTALIGASLLHQRYFHTFGLFHAYTVLLLLWVISLTGMWFVIHAWVFDILRKKKRRMATFSFWRRIVFEPGWFTLQLSLMGGYGLYVTFTRDSFAPPDCVPQLFKNKIWSIFLYSFAAAPFVNSCMLFMLTSFCVWICSVLIAACSGQGWQGHVDPLVFCILWLIEYILMMVGLIVTIETQVSQYTIGLKNGWPFGSTLALLLIVVPLRVVFVRAWRLGPGGREDETRHGRPGSESSYLLPPAMHSRMSSDQTLVGSTRSSAYK
ncbi:hypothetical protein FRC08_009513 [Ceratobasidium sp. 394]|nr:hypothetical protein FRC08_009513 [Ceratobasidium sp. 394]